MIPSWLYLSEISGTSGVTILTISADTNQASGERICVLNVDNSHLIKNLIIQQLFESGSSSEIFIVEPDSINAPMTGGTYRIRIICNREWTVSYPNWISGITSGSGNTDITITILANQTGDDLTGNIVVSTTNNSKTIPVSQSSMGNDYLTIEAISAGTIYWYSRSDSIDISFNKNNTSWQTITTTAGQDNTITTLGIGDIVKFKGNSINIGVETNCFKFSTKAKVYGNIMSLIYGDNYRSQSSYNAYLGGLFSLASGVVDASELIIPQNSYQYSCYSAMFRNCTSLINPPILTATTLSQGCYHMMFKGCTSLVTAPALPATTLAANCYDEMFRDCTSLVNPPELPATTLSGFCYSYMFVGCTSLVTAPALPATTLAPSCYSHMFEGSTSLVQAPELPAATLVEYCYYNMFYDCTSLNYIKCLATNISATNCTTDWVGGYYGVSPTGTFIKKSGVNWPTGDSGIHSGWTVQEE